MAVRDQTRADQPAQATQVTQHMSETGSKMGDQQDTPRPPVAPSYHAAPPEVNAARLIAESADPPRVDAREVTMLGTSADSSPPA